MAKYYGKIGYSITEESKPGVWKPQTIEKESYGDVLQFSSRMHTNADTTNDNIRLANVISIVADPFALQNFQYIKYIEWLGAKWKVTEVKVKRPRLLLTIGGVYNGEDD